MWVAYDVALDLIRALRPVIAQLRGYSPEAADPIERAASIVLNLAEGDHRHGRDPRRFLDMAHGSAGEIRGALDLADAWAGRSRASRRVRWSIASWVCGGALPAEVEGRSVEPFAIGTSARSSRLTG